MRAFDLAWRAFGEADDPFALALDGALARLLLAAFLREALLLLLEPGRVVALVGNAAAAVELEDPARDVVEEVAVVGDDQDRAGIGAQVSLEPGGRLGVEVVRGLVEEQEVRLLEQQLAQRDAALLAARQLVDAASRPAGSAARPSPGRPCESRSHRPFASISS